MKRCDILSFILALEVNAVNSVCGVYSWMEKGILGGKIRRMKLYLVRHGETDWNKVKRIQGCFPIPGRKQLCEKRTHCGKKEKGHAAKREIKKNTDPGYTRRQLSCTDVPIQKQKDRDDQ